jgi:hypothetical protein
MPERPDVEIEAPPPSEHPIVRVVPADVGALRAELERVIAERDEKAREVVRLEGERQRLEGDLAFAVRVIHVRTAQVAQLAAFRDAAMQLAGVE